MSMISPIAIVPIAKTVYECGIWNPQSGSTTVCLRTEDLHELHAHQVAVFQDPWKAPGHSLSIIHYNSEDRWVGFQGMSLPAASIRIPEGRVSHVTLGDSPAIRFERG